jgi:DNA-binding response OmpR family regulator
MMSLQLILMLGKDTAQIEPMRTTLEEESIIGCQVLDSLENAVETAELLLPDLLLIFADSLEAEGENVNAFCLKIRERFIEYRPVIVVYTAAEDEIQRIDYLRDGADDTMSSSVSFEEARIRLLVQLRRNLEILSHRFTRIPGLILSAKFLQRHINLGQGWAFLLVELDAFEEYVEVYGQIPGEQVLRTFGAMMGAAVLPPDFIGHLEANVFSVVTTPEKSEKIAALLCQQFESVTPNFYSESDQQRGYLVSVVDERVSRRVGLLSLSIGIVSSQTRSYDSYKAAITAANDMKCLAKMKQGNHWVSERLQLTGTQSAVNTVSPSDLSILIVESDAALAFLLKTTLEMEAYSVDAVGDISEATRLLEQKAYHLVLMDSLIQGEALGWELCQTIKAKYPHVFVVFISTLHDRDMALGAGADMYMPKPFELVPLFTWIYRLMRGR